MKKASEDFPQTIIDPKAETMAELIASCPLGEVYARKFAKEKLASGAWEKVWKEGPNKHLRPAYRRKS